MRHLTSGVFATALFLSCLQIETASAQIKPATGFGKDLLIGDGEVVDGFDFAMIRGGVITGRVTDSEGRPVVEEFVHLEEVDQSIPLAPGAEAVQGDDCGIYRAFGVPLGKYRVSAGLGDAGFAGGARSRTLS